LDRARRITRPLPLWRLNPSGGQYNGAVRLQCRGRGRRRHRPRRVAESAGSLPMKVHLHGGDLHLTEIHTRIPFKYGIATLTTAPHAFLRLRVEIDGRLWSGIAADTLPSKWFTKDPAKPLDLEVAEMLGVIEHALQSAAGIRGESAFAVWRQLYEVQAD